MRGVGIRGEVEVAVDVDVCPVCPVKFLVMIFISAFVANPHIVVSTEFKQER